MKNFNRNDRSFSLCGLNCWLCTMYLDRHCPGCGGGEGNQSCAIARCSIQHGGVEYCCRCGDYPCERYQSLDEFDSFITHRNRLCDLERLERIGPDAYRMEQGKKAESLKLLLNDYNDGRRKTFFCVAVNLLEPQELDAAMAELAAARTRTDLLPQKEKAEFAAALFQEMAARRNLELKLKRKPGKKK